MLRTVRATFKGKSLLEERLVGWSERHKPWRSCYDVGRSFCQVDWKLRWFRGRHRPILMGTWKYQVSTYRRHQFPFPFTLSKEMSLPAAIGLSLNVVFILFLIAVYTCCCLYNGVQWISLIVLKLRGAGMVSSHWHLQAHGAADLFRCLSHLCGTKRIARVVHVHLFASSSQTRKPKSQFCCDDVS